MTPNYSINIIGENEHTVRFQIKNGTAPLSFEEVFHLWATDEAFILFYKRVILDFNYLAFYWEHPALRSAYLSKKYECILQRSRPLERLSINENAFSSYIHSEADVEDFMNLGKNARLVIPTKKTDQEIYNHLGKFIRLATEKQIISVFKSLGKVVLQEIEKEKNDLAKYSRLRSNLVTYKNGYQT